MNKISKMAAFVQYNMPQNDPLTLTPQEAYDVSAYIHNKPHKPFNEAYRNYGSWQESGKVCVLRGFLKSDEFGSRGG